MVREEPRKFGALERIAAATRDEGCTRFQCQPTPRAEPRAGILRYGVDDPPPVRLLGIEPRRAAEVQVEGAPPDAPDNSTPHLARQCEQRAGSGEQDVGVERL